MNILVLGSGGREHAFAWAINKSENCQKLYVAPGNAGTASIAENVNIGVSEFDKISRFITEKHIDLLVVGPEAPLVDGLRDYLEDKPEHSKLLIVGPGKVGAQLEGSKDFSKGFMQKHGIPTAASITFTKETLEEAKKYISGLPTPIVLKADGLAAGKGVLICESHEDAFKSISKMLEDEQFGAASKKVVIEEFLKGIELSVFVLTDGKDYVILPEAKDYKRIGENDSGPNTGGMGAVSPVDFAHKGFLDRVEKEDVQPTISGLQKDNIPYIGFIFIGLMNVDGAPYVIEYNVRMGDPETQVVFPRINSDVLDLLVKTAQKDLNNAHYDTISETATTVVMVSGGYPGSYDKGQRIYGLENNEPDTVVFHAGTKKVESDVVTSGGRVLNITGIAPDLASALGKSYKRVNLLCWEDVYFRRDIGQDLLALSRK